MMSALDGVVHEAWLWLVGSILLAVFWTNLARLFSPWVEGERSDETFASLAERIVFRVAHWRLAPSLFQGFRLLYYVGLPFAALFWGHDAVVGRHLGLQQLILPTSEGVSGSASLSNNWADWANDLGWAAMLGFGSAGLLLLAALAHRHALSTTESDRHGGRASGWKTAREAFYHEIHWAFYRNAPIVALGSYWGTWAGLALAALEATLNPAWRDDLRHPGWAWSRSLRAALAVISSLVFLQTQNLWLTLLLHWGISWLLGAVYQAPRPGPYDATSSPS